MKFKELIQTLLLGLILSLSLFFSIEPDSIAAEISTSAAATGEGFPRLESAVDRYLMTIPAGYYTIGKVEELKSLMAKSQPLLVDVREPAEYRSGHIPGATNIPLQTLARNLNKIPTDRPVVLYCSTGYRSAMGVMTLHLLNYDNVQGFPPSFAGWKASGELISKN
jgi:rhodanese-related sulfurtransferase